MDFQSFLTFMDDETPVNVNSELLIQKLENTLLQILEKRFPQKQKQSIQKLSSRINFACTYCGDSDTNQNKKRGNIYLANLNFKCFNCGHSAGISKFMYDNGYDGLFDENELEHIRKLKLESQKSLGTGSLSGHSTDLFDIIKYGIPRQHLMDTMGLVKIENNERIRNYLGQRQIRDFTNFAYDRHQDHLIVFNQDPDGKVIGMQRRIQKPKYKHSARFISYKYSDIWEKIFEVEVNQEISAKIDRFSLIYNILKVNFNFTTFVFEGAIDAQTLHERGLQSIATLSASQKVNFELGYYFYDNSKFDSAGADASIWSLNNGYNTFMWGRFLEDFPKFESCKDVNEILKLEPGFNVNKFLDYFTQDELDLIYI